MILIADSGSTKCDWVLLDSQGEVILKTSTLGLNPAILNEEEVISILKSNSDLLNLKSKNLQLDFYGAGCGTETPRKNLQKILSDYFKNVTVTVQEDMMAAVYSVTTEPAIICILGTGSNSCYFDGKKIHQEFPSLGYTIMDEASGNYYGKQLLQDYYFNNMPWEIALQFNETFLPKSDEIKEHLYKKPNPNAYLASFAKFIFNTEDQDFYLYNLQKVGLSKFIKNHILCFYEAKNLPIHFIGSIAYFSQDIIKKSLKEHELKLGKIIQKPMEGLIEYYKKEKLQTPKSN